jgi:hypothetical protein
LVEDSVAHVIASVAKQSSGRELSGSAARVTRDEAIRRLQQHEADMKRLGVEHLYMFGSTARGEAKEDSDGGTFFDHEGAGSVSSNCFNQAKERDNRWRLNRSLKNHTPGNAEGVERRAD